MSNLFYAASAQGSGEFMSLRSVAERLSREVVLTRRLPKEFGGARIVVSPGAGGLRYWGFDLSKVDPDLLRLARLVQKDAVVWDFGANVGLFTFAAAFRAGPFGKVISVEADVDNVRLLLRSRRGVSTSIDYAPVEILPVAVSGPRSRFAAFEIAARARSSNSLAGFGHSQSGGIRETRHVAIVTPDEMLHSFPPPNLVKVDVEGAEVSVLEGSTRLLTEVRPVMFLEVGGEHAEAVADRLHGHDYALFDGTSLVLLTEQTPTATWSCIAVPSEKVETIQGWDRATRLG